MEIASLYATLSLKDKDFSSGLKNAEGQLNGFGKKLDYLGGSVRNAGQSASLAITTPLAAVGGLLVKSGADFEQSMANVVSVTGGGAEALTKLKTAARKAGEDTVFSASEAADAMYYMGSAGWDADQIVAGLGDTLLLAAGAGKDLSFTSDLMTSTISQFNLKASDAGRVANVFAAASAYSQANLDKLAYSMSYVGPVANSLGWSIESTTAGLMGLYNAGFKGEQAGTILRGALDRLMNPPKEVAERMGKLGISMDALNPQTHSLAQIIDYLKGKNLSAKDALVLFGEVAGPGMLALLSQGGAALTDYEQKITNTNKATEMAATMNDTLWGSFKQLSSKLEEIGLQVFDTIGPIIRKFVDGPLTDFVNWFKNLDTATKQVVVFGAALAAGIGPALIVLGLMLPAIGAVVGGLSTLALAPVAVIAAFVGMAATVIGAITSIELTSVTKFAAARLAAVTEAATTAATVLASYASMALGAIGSLVTMTAEVAGNFLMQKAIAISHVVAMVPIIGAKYAMMAQGAIYNLGVMLSTSAVKFGAMTAQAIGSTVKMVGTVIAQYVLMAGGAAKQVAKMVASTIGGFLTMAAAVAGPIALVIAAITAIGLALMVDWGQAGRTLAAGFERAKEVIGQVFTQLQSGDYVGAFNTLKSAAGEALDWISTTIKNVDWAAAFKKGFEKVGQVISDVVVPAIQDIDKRITEWANAGGPEELGKKIGQLIGDGISWVISHLTGGSSDPVQAIKNVFNKVVEYATIGWNIAKGIAEGVFQKLAPYLAPAYNSVRNWIIDTVVLFVGWKEDIINAAKGVVTKISEALTPLTTWINDNVIKPIKDKLAEWKPPTFKIPSCWEDLKGIITDMWDTLTKITDWKAPDSILGGDNGMSENPPSDNLFGPATKEQQTEAEDKWAAKAREMGLQPHGEYYVEKSGLLGGWDVDTGEGIAAKSGSYKRWMPLTEAVKLGLADASVASEKQRNLENQYRNQDLPEEQKLRVMSVPGSEKTVIKGSEEEGYTATLPDWLQPSKRIKWTNPETGKEEELYPSQIDIKKMLQEGIPLWKIEEALDKAQNVADDNNKKATDTANKNAQTSTDAANAAAKTTTTAANAAAKLTAEASNALRLGAEISGKFLGFAGNAIAIAVDKSTGQQITVIGQVAQKQYESAIIAGGITTKAAEESSESTKQGGKSLEQSGQRTAGIFDVTNYKFSENVKSASSTAGSTTINSTNTATNNFKGGVGNAVNNVQNGFEIAKQKIEAAGDVGTKILIAGQYFANTVLTASSYFVNQVSIVSRILAASVSGGKKYTAFASGGIVNKPTFALIGEAGPEAVIPLNDVMKFAEGGVIAPVGSSSGVSLSANFVVDLQSLTTNGMRIFNSFKDFLRITWSIIKFDAINTWNQAKTQLQTIWTETRGSAYVEFSAIKNLVISNDQLMRDNALMTFQSMRGDASGTWTGMKEDAQKQLTDIQTSFVNTFGTAKSSLINALSDISSTLSTKLPEIQAQFDAMLNNATTGINNFIQQLIKLNNLTISPTISPNYSSGGGSYGGEGGGGCIAGYDSSGRAISYDPRTNTCEDLGFNAPDPSLQTTDQFYLNMMGQGQTSNSGPTSSAKDPWVGTSLEGKTGGGSGPTSTANSRTGHNDIGFSAGYHGSSLTGGFSGKSGYGSFYSSSSSSMSGAVKMVNGVAKIGKYARTGIAKTPQIATIAEGEPEIILTRSRFKEFMGLSSPSARPGEISIPESAKAGGRFDTANIELKIDGRTFARILGVKLVKEVQNTQPLKLS